MNNDWSTPVCNSLFSPNNLVFAWQIVFMRDAQKKILERIETIVTSFNGQRTALELIVNHSRENSGRIYVQPVGSFANVIECGFIFESRFAVFDFGRIEMQVEYAKPETVMRVLDTFRSTVAAHLKGQVPCPVLVRT